MCPAPTCATAAEKYITGFLKKDTGSSSRRVSGVGIRFMCSSLSVTLPLFTKQAGKERAAGGGVQAQKTCEEFWPDCAGNAISCGLNIERHQGHQQERVVCFSTLCVPF